MLMLDSEFKKVIMKFFILFMLFISIIISCFYYFQNKTIAFAPIKIKADYLLSKYPNPQIIIGGDSVAESGINSLEFKSFKVVNLSYQGTGFVSFAKIIEKYFVPNGKTTPVFLYNFSILNTNDSTIRNDRYINLIDNFLDEGIVFLIKNWKTDFFRNFIYVIQCKYINCKFYDEDLIDKNINEKTLGFNPLYGTLPNQKELDKNFTRSYELFYKEYNGLGVVTRNSLKRLEYLLQRKYNFVITFLPVWDPFKKRNSLDVKGESVRAMVLHITSVCNKYKNCKTIDFLTKEKPFDDQNSSDSFNDYAHLNKKGAKVFTRLLEKKIILAIKEF